MSTAGSPDGEPAEELSESGEAREGQSLWRRLRGQAAGLARLTAEAAADIDHGWPVLAAWAAAGCLLVVTGFRLLVAFAVTAGTGVAVAGVAVVTAAAVALLVGLAWASWRIRLDVKAAAPVAVALGIALAAIGICTEAFAALTVLLWQHGLVGAASGAGPGLWAAEKYYLWHLADSVPLLKIPEGVQWREPALFPGLPGSGLLLAYKVLLIAPLLRVGIAAYTLIIDHVVKAQHRERSSIGSEALPAWVTAWMGLSLALLLALPAIIVWLMRVVFEPGAGLDGWLADRLGHGGFAFLHPLPQWLAAVLLVGLAVSLASELIDSGQVWYGRELVLLLAMFLAEIGLLVAAAAAVNLALLHAGLASASPAMAPGEQVLSTVDGYAWHLADALPGPGIPGTLHWTLHHDFTDRWSTTLILLVKLAMLILIAVPVTRAIRQVAVRARLRHSPGALATVARFTEQFMTTQVAADRMVRNLAAGKGLVPPAGKAARVLVARLDDVEALFGSGDVSRPARVAASALRRRTREFSPFDQRQLREEEDESFAAYRAAASRMLQAASDEFRTRARPTDSGPRS